MLFNAWAGILKERRKALGLTQEAVVSRMPGVKEVNTYGRWERGEVPPSAHFFTEIAKALELDEGELGRRYTAALNEHYFPEIREGQTAYGTDAAEAALEEANVEGLASDVQAHLLRQRDGLKSQLSGLRLASSGLDVQIASFVATVLQLRQRFGLDPED